MYCSIKCKQCRNFIFSEEECKSLFVNSHSEKLVHPTMSECDTEDVVYLNEDFVPQWVKDRIESENWSKGRINCQRCDSRIGAFNFITGQKCNCSQCILPFVHLIKSKVDLIKPVSS